MKTHIAALYFNYIFANFVTYMLSFKFNLAQYKKYYEYGCLQTESKEYSPMKILFGTLKSHKKEASTSEDELTKNDSADGR